MEQQPRTPTSPALHYLPRGFFPMQCDDCGRMLINMGCEKCNPYTPPIVRNRAGFPAYGQLSPKKTPLRMYESPKSRIKSGYKLPRVMRRVQFGEVKGRVLELTIDDKRSKKGGTEMTFAKFVGKEVSLAVLTKYEWLTHTWETRDIHYHRDTTEAVLLNTLGTHIPRMAKELKQCDNSHACLCGGPDSSVTWNNVRVLGYTLSLVDGALVFRVKIGPK